jgi:hypothetical protein
VTPAWRAATAVCVGLVGASLADAQQVADTSFRPAVGERAFGAGSGPVVAIDAGHRNFHTADGRYRAFAELARRDGYRVRSLAAPFSQASLAGIDVLVIANALHPRNEEDWTLPVRSAFTAVEIDAVRAWVAGGGALLLIADHMPFPGAAADLAAAFGFTLSNGFALDTVQPGAPIVFRRTDGSLAAGAVADGRSPAERVDSVVTFTGEAFRGPPDAMPLLTLRSSVVSLMPDTAWQFSDETPRIAVGGWWQGALAAHGRGRVAVFGEAAMFTAQVAGPERQPMGMNVPAAAQNAQLLLNVLHWMSGLLD